MPVQIQSNNALRVLAIDPGPKESGVVFYDHSAHKCMSIFEGEKPEYVVSTNRLLEFIRTSYVSSLGALVVEDVVCYGMPVGKDIFDTCKVIGNIQEIVRYREELLSRKEVKMHLCNSTRAKDSNVLVVLTDRFCGWYDWPNQRIKGTQAKPGPLYGMKDHGWAALAVAVAWCEIQEEKSCT